MIGKTKTLVANIILACCIIAGPTHATTVKAGNHIKDYQQKQLSVCKVPVNDSLYVLSFHDSLPGVTCSGYLQSTLELPQPCGDTSFINPIKGIGNQKTSFIINQQPYIPQNNIPDYLLMLPTTMAVFTKGEYRYLAINMDMVSSMAGGHWFCLLLRIKDGKVISDVGWQGSHPFGIKDFNKEL